MQLFEALEMDKEFVNLLRTTFKHAGVERDANGRNNWGGDVLWTSFSCFSFLFSTFFFLMVFVMGAGLGVATG